MRIERLDVVDVRSFARASLEPGPGLTVFVGPNGVGKTNLLEACAVVLTGASPRTSSELRLVRDGADGARIAASVRIGDVVGAQEVRIVQGRGKQLLQDGSPVRGVEQFAARAPAVSFLPERLLVIRGAPARRRALVDGLIARLDAAAAAQLRDYTRALQQRNVLLRRARSGRDVRELLIPWTQLLVEHGTAVRAARNRVLEALRGPFDARLLQLTGLADGEFVAQLRGGEGLEAAYAEALDHDLRRGSTTVGPHLDDLLPQQAGRDIRTYGSTGEQRAVLLAFTLAASDLLEAATGLEPVLLVDEPWSELDADRRGRLSDVLLDRGQVLATTTEPPRHLLERRAAGADIELRGISSGTITPWQTTDDTNLPAGTSTTSPT